MHPRNTLVPSVLTPHTDSVPALTDVNLSSGGGSLWPQQPTVRSARTPQPTPFPTLMDVNVPTGEALGGSWRTMRNFLAWRMLEFGI